MAMFAFGSTWARHTCGISLEWNFLFVWLYSGQQKWSTLMLACGGDPDDPIVA